MMAFVMAAHVVEVVAAGAGAGFVVDYVWEVVVKDVAGIEIVEAVVEFVAAVFYLLDYEVVVAYVFVAGIHRNDIYKDLKYHSLELVAVLVAVERHDEMHGLAD